jgi:GT2 family glycosyltransferase
MDLGSPRMARNVIALVVPVMKRFDLFTKLMASVDEEVFPIIVPNYENNIGVAGAWNYGMRKAIENGCEYALVCNDDITFTPGAIAAMIDVLKETDALLVSPNQNGEKAVVNLIEDGADFFCFAVKPKQLVQAVGWFDENIYPAYFEDNDMHYRMKLAGIRSYIDTRIVVDHFGSATQNADEGNPNVPASRFQAIKAYYARKWGGEPHNEKFTTPWDKPKLNLKAWKGQDVVDPDNLELDNFFTFE